jgi:hypothetical protein
VNRSYTYEQLIEKIVTAKVLLKKMKPKQRNHPDTCPVEDPHMAGLCTCGADKFNNEVYEQFDEIEEALSF